MASKQTHTQVSHRSAVNGRFITERQAERAPDKSIREVNRVPAPAPAPAPKKR